MNYIKTILISLILFQCSIALGQNLIVNGDFEDPSLVGVSSEYTHTPGGNAIEGSWWISPWNPGAPWDPQQHTVGGVAAMNANGDDSAIAGIKKVWFQTVPVVPGRVYRFGVWALGTGAGPGAYSLRLDANNIAISAVFSPAVARTYTEHSAEFVANSTSVELSIKNVSGITFPNDFMLDDLTLVDITPCFPDLNDDGAVDFFDISFFLTAYSEMDPVADFNNDGQFDFFDISDFIGAFTDGCP